MADEAYKIALAYLSSGQPAPSGKKGAGGQPDKAADKKEKADNKKVWTNNMSPFWRVFLRGQGDVL